MEMIDYIVDINKNKSKRLADAVYAVGGGNRMR